MKKLRITLRPRSTLAQISAIRQIVTDISERLESIEVNLRSQSDDELYIKQLECEITELQNTLSILPVANNVTSELALKRLLQDFSP